MPNVPRNAPAGRLSSGMLAESVERDLGVSDSQTVSSTIGDTGASGLTVVASGVSYYGIAEIDLCGPVIVTETSPGVLTLDLALPVQTLELAAQPAGSDEKVRQSIVPYDVSWATEYRYVVYVSNIHAAVLQARYHDGTSWQNAGTSYTTGVAAALSYVSDWQEIPAGWKAVGDAFLQVAATNEPDVDCDMPYVALQFRRSCSVCSTITVAPSCGTVTITPSGTIATTGLIEFGDIPGTP